MSTFGIATEALTPAPTAELSERHLSLVDSVAGAVVASEVEIDYFNDLAGDEQIAFGD